MGIIMAAEKTQFLGKCYNSWLCCYAIPFVIGTTTALLGHSFADSISLPPPPRSLSPFLCDVGSFLGEKMAADSSYPADKPAKNTFGRIKGAQCIHLGYA